ncbi:MAG: NfeD family protein [Algicola sp.]|nr:NfeD family protein [Algicola sp.]
MFDLAGPVSIWVLVGVILMAAELFIPGGIVIFLGGACLIVAGALQLGFINGWVVAMTLWFILSIILLLSFRNVTQKLVGGDVSKANTEEDMEIYGKTAKVTETIGPGEKTGRIEFQDSSWMALADGSVIEPGETVTIICHDNISMVVEKTTSLAT